MDDFIKLTAELGSRRIGFTIPTDPHITQGEVVHIVRTALDKLRQKADCGSYGGRFLDTPSQYIEPVNMTNTQKENKNMSELQKSADRLKTLGDKLTSLQAHQESGFDRGFQFGTPNQGGTNFDTKGCGLSTSVVQEFARILEQGIKKQIAAEIQTIAKLIGPSAL